MRRGTHKVTAWFHRGDGVLDHVEIVTTNGAVAEAAAIGLGEALASMPAQLTQIEPPQEEPHEHDSAA